MNTSLSKVKKHALFYETLEQKRLMAADTASLFKAGGDSATEEVSQASNNQNVDAAPVADVIPGQLELIEAPDLSTPIDDLLGSGGPSVSAEQYAQMFVDNSSQFRLEAGGANAAKVAGPAAETINGPTGPLLKALRHEETDEEENADTNQHTKDITVTNAVQDFVRDTASTLQHEEL